MCVCVCVHTCVCVCVCVCVSVYTELNKLEDLNATAQQDGSIAITYKVFQATDQMHIHNGYESHIRD